MGQGSLVACSEGQGLPAVLTCPLMESAEALPTGPQQIAGRQGLPQVLEVLQERISSYDEKYRKHSQQDPERAAPEQNGQDCEYYKEDFE